MTLTRRRFMQIATATLATRALPLHAQTPLTLGIGTFCYHGLSIDAMIAELKRVLPGNGPNHPQIEMSLEEFMLFRNPPEQLFVSTRQKLDRAGIRCVSYYAATLRNEQDVARAVHLAQLLGAQNITGEGNLGKDLLKQIDRSVTQAGLTFGLHNHFVKGGKFPYQSPDEVLRAVSDLSANCGAAADTGHFAACGFDTVDALRKLASRLKIVHLKDVQAVGNGDNVVLGTGIARIAEVEEQLRIQNFAHLAAIEYDTASNNVIRDMRSNMKYAVAHSLA